MGAIATIGVGLYAVVETYAARLRDEYEVLRGNLERGARRYRELADGELIHRFHLNDRETLIISGTGFTIPARDPFPPKWWSAKKRPYTPFQRINYDREWPPSLRFDLDLPFFTPILRLRRHFREHLMELEKLGPPPEHRDRGDTKLLFLAISYETLGVLYQARWVTRLTAALLTITVLGSAAALGSYLVG